MTAEIEKTQIKNILKKCDIYYDDALISKEILIQKYIDFIGESLFSDKRMVSFALHTGSICFEIISIIAASLRCLLDNQFTSDQIISSLKENDYVLYKEKSGHWIKYRWKGFKIIDNKKYMNLEHDEGKGCKPSTLSLPVNRYQHSIKPYYGNSQRTAGKGIKKKKTNRENFLAFISSTDERNIPTQIDKAIVIVAERFYFSEIYKKISLRYDRDKEVKLYELIPAAYYTNDGKKYQIGENPTKTEPSLKIINGISRARSLVLNKDGNETIGLLITGNAFSSKKEEFDTLAELTTIEALRFVSISSPLKNSMKEYILKKQPESLVFACTKSMISENDQIKIIQEENKFTEELNTQIKNVVNYTINSIPVENGLSWEEYESLINLLSEIKQSEWPNKENFRMKSFSLLKLINTAIFPLEIMEKAIHEGKIKIESPSSYISELKNISDRAGSVTKQCQEVVERLESKYREYLENCPKENRLKRYLDEKRGHEILVIVPKEYYIKLLEMRPITSFLNKKVSYNTPRSSINQKYDIILHTGIIYKDHSDLFQYQSTSEIDLLLYDHEKHIFEHKQRKFEIDEQKLICEKSDQIKTPKENNIPRETREVEETLHQISSLNEEFDKFSINKALDTGRSTLSSLTDRASLTEIEYIGTCISGEKIFFSRYYHAVVFNQDEDEISEKTPEDLQPGDMLVFIKRDNYTKNIVDTIYERLREEGSLNQKSLDDYENAQRWKKALYGYMVENRLTYKELTKKLKQTGSNIVETTVRQWLIEDSHIVGPQKEESLRQIAIVTKDPFLQENYSSVYEACKNVRSQRRRILQLIANAIKNKFGGNHPQEEENFLTIVYNEVDNLSETVELEEMKKLDSIQEISSALINRPILLREELM